MDAGVIIDMFTDGMNTVILAVAIIVLPGLCVGLLVSVFQAATQINEQTLSLIPRLLTTMFTIIVCAPFLLKLILALTNDMFGNINILIG
ncbi:MAG: flagellar biosynthetic protein FliQ [Francisellaceae bacterium]|jgi:flagellar biosynthesis protein FliQ|nr:flagellar biosynthetic protein FliQ [Francisellaceae bacterium]MBT6207788.1 flagellar biosynthetic protein FliQ [Francisellaceae bacterium]MBT6539669.1 flagellar biosynthetic protein FliQ [Francisellaceae bacterium]